MRGRLLAVVTAAAVLPVLGCGGASAPPAPTTVMPPIAYVRAVQDLLVPPARMASLAAGRARPEPEGSAPSQQDVDVLIRAARRQLREFMDQRIEFAPLRRQRDALAGAYQATIGGMERVGRDLVQDDRDALRRDLPSFFMSMRGLSSAVSPPSR